MFSQTATVHGMRIQELVAYHIRIPLKTKIRHALHVRTENDSLLVNCLLDDGSQGWGEGLPREYVTGESIDEAWNIIQQLDLNSLRDAQFDTLKEAIPLAQVVLPPTPKGKRECFGNSIRCAFELSILDAVCRSKGIPLSAVIDYVPGAADLKSSVSKVRYSGAITTMSPRKEFLRAALFRLSGFRQCKVKVGVAGVDDARALKRIRGVLGRKMDIRIDANEAWQPDEVVSKMQPLLPYNITALEQPVPHARVDQLAEIRSQIPVPIMLDESLCSIPDGERAINNQTCDLFNIRISKCGGFITAVRLAALAHQAGLGMQLGCMVGETGILSAAGRHFASSIRNIRYLEGSFDRFLVKERLTKQDLTFGWGGLAPALSGPGSGVDIDAQAVKRVTIARTQLL